MKPKIEQPKQYTPEEVAQLEKSRTISDAELLKDKRNRAWNHKTDEYEDTWEVGGEYIIDPTTGEKKGLSITKARQEDLKKQQVSDENYERESIIGRKLGKLRLRSGEGIRLKLAPEDLREDMRYGDKRETVVYFFKKEDALDIEVMDEKGRTISVRLGDIIDVVRAE